MNPASQTLVEARAPSRAAARIRPRAAARFAGSVLVAALALGGMASVSAQSGPPGSATAAMLFRDADLAEGERLIREHRCSECHARRVGGDGSAIYRPKGRIVTPGFLRGMVELCSTELNLGFFPEETTSVAAVLNRDHYRFD